MTIPDLNPLGYTGLKQKNPPNVRYFHKDPTVSDYTGFDIGDFWINTQTKTSYQLMSKAQDPVTHLPVSDWQVIGGPTVQISNITTDTIANVPPVNGTMDVLGTNGIQTTSTGDGNITINFTGVVPEDITVTGGVSGSARQIVVRNDDNTSINSSAIVTTRTGGALGGDPFFASVINGVTSWSFGTDNADSDSFKISNNGTLGTNDRIRISHTTGAVNMPSQPSFTVALQNTLNDVTGDGTDYSPIIFDTEISDVGNNFDIATGIFTAPHPGMYLFNAGLRYALGATTATSIAFTLDVYTGVVNTVSYSLYTENDGAVSNFAVFSIGRSIVIPLIAGQKVQLALRVNGDALTVDLVGQTASAYNCYFSGAMLS